MPTGVYKRTIRKPREKRYCSKCGQSYEYYPCQPKKYCSSECYWSDKIGTVASDDTKEKMSKSRLGKPLKGRTVMATGYIQIYVFDSDRRCGKRAFEHRFIMEKVVGRKLMPKEVVHHINGIRSDNQIENLRLMNKIEHDKLHKGGSKPWRI